MAESKPTGTLGTARIAGRIQGQRVVNSNGAKTFRTILKLPAADVYSSPATVEVRSQERLGAVQDEISILVGVGGFPRSYEHKGQDGESQKVQTAENVLQFLAVA